MDKTSTNIITLCSNVCSEFDDLGFKIDTDPRTQKESYNIQKQPNGQWFKLSKNGLHETASLTPLDLTKMPALLKLTELINHIDPEINKKGGRLFITQDLVYKIKRGTETPLIFKTETAENSNAKFFKLCEEIKSHGLGPDRYRVQETYLLTKSANGEWSITSSHENHSGTKTILDLKVMPHLKNLTLKLGKLDPQFQKNGGRIFIELDRIYRIKNKVELDYKI